MSHRTTRSERRGRGARVVLATVLALATMAVGATAANAATFSITKKTDVPTTTVFNFKVDYQAFANDSGPNASDTQPPATFTLTSGETKTFDQVHKGWYTVSELTADGWKLVDISCAPQDPQPSDAYKIDLGAGSVGIELSPEESKACTFTNNQVVVPGPTPGPGPSGGAPVTAAGQTPAVSVLPTAVRPSAARLSAPTSCVSRRYTVKVSGSPVRSVRWYVNGHFVRTTRATKSGQRLFTTQFSPGANLQRVQARVTFASGASPVTRSLQVTVRRCSPSAVRPQFTG
jgi:hypothetical protein